MVRIVAHGLQKWYCRLPDHALRPTDHDQSVGTRRWQILGEHLFAHVADAVFPALTIRIEKVAYAYKNKF